jgi:hypothetical protein
MINSLNFVALGLTLIITRAGFHGGKTPRSEDLHDLTMFGRGSGQSAKGKSDETVAFEFLPETGPNPTPKSCGATQA